MCLHGNGFKNKELRMKTTSWRMVALCLLTTGVSVAQADLYVATYTGRVTSAGGAYPSGISVGNTISGTFQFDDDHVDASPANNNMGNYVAAIISETLIIGSAVGAGDSLQNILILENFNDPRDELALVGSGGTLGGSAMTSVLLQLVDTDHTVFASDTLAELLQNPLSNWQF